jgi:hypothetical protein
MMTLPTLRQLIVSINRPPVGGSLVVAPTSGVALVTNFSCATSGWTEPEADLPLTYMYVLEAPLVG